MFAKSDENKSFAPRMNDDRARRRDTSERRGRSIPIEHLQEQRGSGAAFGQQIALKKSSWRYCTRGSWSRQTLPNSRSSWSASFSESVRKKMLVGIAMVTSNRPAKATTQIARTSGNEINKRNGADLMVKTKTRTDRHIQHGAHVGADQQLDVVAIEIPRESVDQVRFLFGMSTKN